MVVLFDFSTFYGTCSRLSKNYGESLTDFDVIATVVFKDGDKWCNQDVTHSVGVSLVKLQG